MRRYLTTLLLPAAVSLALMWIGSKAEHPEELGLGEGSKTTLEEIGKAGQFALALLIGSAAIKEVIESALKESGKELKQTIGETFGDTSEKVESGFNGLTGVVRAALLELKINVQLVRDAPSLKESDAAVAKEIPPVAAELAREGKAGEAMLKIAADPKTKLEQEIAVLILSTQESDWEKAATLLEQSHVKRSDDYHRLSFKFWSAGRLDKAVEMAEGGLAVATKTPHAELVALELKNNLAYFYADANRMDKKAEAFEYIREARSQWPASAEIVETEGCVKIAFGTKDEALEGVQECMKVAAAKGDTSTLDHWMKRYTERKF